MPAPGAAVTMGLSAATRILRFARRGMLPALALVAMVPCYGAAYNLGFHVPGLAFAAPGELVLRLALVALAVTFPVLLFAASGVSPRRWWRVGVAVVIAGYGAAVARPVAFHLLAASDHLTVGRIPDGRQAQVAMGREMIRADPEAAARRAVRGGDTRVFAVEGIVLWPVGVRWTPATRERLGVKELPGFSDMGSRDPAVQRYEHEGACWVGRYDRELARLLDTPGLEVDPSFPRCDPPAAAR